METAGLYNKYRARNYKDIVGNSDAVGILKSLSNRKRLPATMLLHGPSGCGKTSLARIYARKLLEVKNLNNCVDYNEVNVGADRGIQIIRDILADTEYAPIGGLRVIVLDEIHTQTPQAFSALQKPLEEPAPGNLWILITDEPDALPFRVFNRTVKIRVSPLEDEEVLTIIKNINDAENFGIKTRYLERVATYARGIPREAITKLEALSLFARLTSELVDSQLHVGGPEIDSSACNILYCLYTYATRGFIKQVLDYRKDVASLVKSMIFYNRQVLQILCSESSTGSGKVEVLIKKAKPKLQTVMEIAINLNKLKTTHATDSETLFALTLNHKE